MVGLMETLVLEMVKRREAKERMVAALERLMKWIEVMDRGDGYGIGWGGFREEDNMDEN